MSDTTKDNYSSDFDQDLPYDLLSRPYYVDSIVFNLDRSPSSDFDSEQAGFKDEGHIIIFESIDIELTQALLGSGCNV